jgi:hypothetical protein
MCCAIPILFAGSSTIVKGTEQQVSVNTPGVPGALCQLQSPAIGTRTAQRPANITMLKSKKNGAGLGVDAAAGAMNTYDPGVEVVMTRCPAASGRRARARGSSWQHACAESDAARLGLPLRQRFR